MNTLQLAIENAQACLLYHEDGDTALKPEHGDIRSGESSSASGEPWRRKTRRIGA